MFWCTLPKIAWCIALYFYFPDRVADLVFALIFSMVVNIVHVIVCEEVMLAVHRGQKGRHPDTG